MTDLLDLDRLADSPWALLLAAVVGVLAVGRATRLITHDSFPPAERFREWGGNRLGDAYGLLVECPWCMAPWLTLVDLIWAVAGTVDVDTISGTIWWLCNLWFALAYVVSMIVVRDEPPE